MNRKVLLYGIAVLCSVAAHGGEVYRSVDANGNAIYRDTPFANATRIEVRTHDPAMVATADVKAQPSSPESDKTDETDKKDACQRAREALDAYDAADYIKTTDAKGNEITLSDEQMRVAIHKAEDEVAQFCYGVKRR